MATLTPLYITGTKAYTANDLDAYTRSGGSWSEGSAITANPHSSMDTSSSFDTTASDGDAGIGLDPAANLGPPATASKNADFDLSSVDADFGAMTALNVRYSSVQFSSFTDDVVGIMFAVFDSSDVKLAGGDPLSTNSWADYFDGSSWSNAASKTGTAPAYDKSHVLTLTASGTSATAADWNGAYLRFYFGIDRSMAADNASIVLVDVELTGTYTPAAPAGGIVVARHRIPRAPLVVR